MAISVEVPGQGTFEFPDDAQPQEIEAALNEQFPPEPKGGRGFWEAAKRGATREATLGFVQPEGEAQTGMEVAGDVLGSIAGGLPVGIAAMGLTGPLGATAAATRLGALAARFGPRAARAIYAATRGVLAEAPLAATSLATGIRTPGTAALQTGLGAAVPGVVAALRRAGLPAEKIAETFPEVMGPPVRKALPPWTGEPSVPGPARRFEAGPLETGEITRRGMTQAETLRTPLRDVEAGALLPDEAWEPGFVAGRGKKEVQVPGQVYEPGQNILRPWKQPGVREIQEPSLLGRKMVMRPPSAAKVVSGEDVKRAADLPIEDAAKIVGPSPKVGLRPAPVAEPAPTGHPFEDLDALRTKFEADTQTFVDVKPSWWAKVKMMSPQVPVMMMRSKNPVMQDAGHEITAWLLNKAHFEETFLSNPILKKVKGNPLVGALQENPVTPATLAATRAKDPDAVHAYEFIRESLAGMAKMLKIPEEQIIDNYFSHYFSRNAIRNILQNNLAKATAAGNSEMVGAAQKALADMNSLQGLRFNNLPKTVKAWFLETRTGQKGYSADAVDVFHRYVRRASDKLYDEPFIRRVSQLLQDPATDDATRGLVRSFIQGVYRDYDTMGSVVRGIRSYEFLAKLGLNTKWATVNALSGQFNNTAKLGLTGAVKGNQLYTNPVAKELFRQSGHEALTGTRWLQEGMRYEVPDWFVLWAPRIEGRNRGAAFLGSLWKSMKMADPSFSDQRFLQMAKEGLGAFPPQAVQTANLTVAETQGMYGKGFDPLWMRGAGRVLQFVGTPLKLFQGMMGAKTMGGTALVVPATYLLGSELLEEALLPIVDLSSALGFGLDVRGLVNDVRTKGLSIGDIPNMVTDRLLKPIQEGRGGVVSFGVGPILGGVENLAWALKNGWKALSGEPVSGIRKPGGRSPLADLLVNIPSHFLNREVVAMGRGTKAISESYPAGGLIEAARTLGGWDSYATRVRTDVLNHLRRGNMNKAQEELMLWIKKYPEQKLFRTPEQLQEAFQAAMQLEMETDVAKMKKEIRKGPAGEIYGKYPSRIREILETGPVSGPEEEAGVGEEEDAED